LADLLAAEGYSICLAETARTGLAALKLHDITHAVIFNAVSLRTNGEKSCTSLKQAAPGLPPLVYSNQMRPARADELIFPGISVRRLINTIELYSPLVKECCLCYGDVWLDEEKQRVQTPRGVSHLSTKGVQILKCLIKKKGGVVSREELFSGIWNTSYMGDLNTLYTHINSLRKAIEQDPFNPCHLITVKGKGYQLRKN
jgi:DNA-binding response OmpR family regulator